MPLLTSGCTSNAIVLLLWIRCTRAVFSPRFFVSGFSFFPFSACNLRLQSTSGRPSQNICISITSSTAKSSKISYETEPECNRTGTQWFLPWNLPNHRPVVMNLPACPPTSLAAHCTQLMLTQDVRRSLLVLVLPESLRFGHLCSCLCLVLLCLPSHVIQFIWNCRGCQISADRKKIHLFCSPFRGRKGFLD